MIDNNISVEGAGISSQFYEIDNFLIMDSVTTSDLELISTKSSTEKSKEARQGLFGAFKCCTYGGERLLRSLLLQPPKSTFIIKEKQKIVKFINKIPPRTRNAISVELTAFKKFDNFAVKLLCLPQDLDLAKFDVVLYSRLLHDIQYLISSVRRLKKLFENFQKENIKNLNCSNFEEEKILENDNLIIHNLKFFKDVAVHLNPGVFLEFENFCEKNFDMSVIKGEDSTLEEKSPSNNNNPSSNQLILKKRRFEKTAIFFLIKPKRDLTIDLSRISFARIEERIADLKDEAKKISKLTGLKITLSILKNGIFFKSKKNNKQILKKFFEEQRQEEILNQINVQF